MQSDCAPSGRPSLTAPVPRCSLLIAVLLAAAPLAAQAQQIPVFEAEANLMEIEVRVTDGRGQAVAGLSKDDFELLEDGKPQEIATFEFVTRLVPKSELADPDTPPSPVVTDPHAAANELRRSTFIYIATRGRREDKLRLVNAIREFIDEQLAPGVFVSLEGAPFTQSESELNARLDEMLAGGTGGTGTGLVDSVAVDLSREFEHSSAFDEILAEANEEFGEQVEEIADRAAFYRRLRMYEYIDLIQALSIYPGRKLVVLFATGLPIDEENMDMMELLEHEATKNRVRFYVSDVEGLTAAAPGGTAEERVSFNSMMGDPLNNGFMAQSNSRQDNQDGLWEMARRTGGRAVLNSNDFGEVFDVVNRESGDYYLLGYYTEDREQRGRFRRLRVKVSQRGLKVSHQRGFYEERPFKQMSRDERNLRMHQALTFDTPYLDLPLEVGHEFFRDSGGAATLVYSVGLHTADIPSVSTKKGEKVKLTIIAQASVMEPEGEPGESPEEPVDEDAEAQPQAKRFLDEKRFEMTVEEAAHERLSTDPTSWLHYGSQMQLPPGRYEWKVIVRDDLSGTLGSYQTQIRIPEASQGLGASTLLLTGRIDDVSGSSASKKKKGKQAAEDVLVVDGSRFYAISAKTFRQGDPFFLLYDVYNPGEPSLAEPPSPRIALYRERERVAQLPVTGYQSVAEPEANRLRQLAALNTEELEAGEYTIVAMLPSESSTRPVIFRKFRLLPAGAE